MRYKEFVSDIKAGERLADLLSPLFSRQNKELYFFCIGSDRSTGDSFGPLVGTFLQRLGVANVIGTLERNVNALNLKQSIKHIPRDAFVIVLDAALGRKEDVGSLMVFDGPLAPGGSRGEPDILIGDLSIIFYVGVYDPIRTEALNTTRLFQVFQGAEVVASGIADALALNKYKMNPSGLIMN